MLTLDCDDLTIRLRMDQCVPEIVRATLTRRNRDHYELVATIDPEDDTRVSLALPPNSPVPMRGVWRLNLETDCRCFGAPVFVDSCRAPAFEGTYHPTADEGPVQVCCAPVLQPLWNGQQVVLGFQAQQVNGLVGLDSDLGLGTLLQPAPSYTDLAFVTAVDEIGGVTFSGTLAPIHAGYTSWTLLDSGGRVVMIGTISGTSLVATSALVALTCATYYLRFSP